MGDAPFLGEIYTTGWYLDLTMKEMLHAWIHLRTVRFRANVFSALPLITILVTGCATAQATSQEDAISDVYTAVALTVSAASAGVSPTATLSAPATPTAAAIYIHYALNIHADP